MNIVGGKSSNDNPYLQLVGKEWDYAPNRGTFCLIARDGTNTSVLKGTPAGELTWTNKKIAVEGNYIPMVNDRITKNDLYVNSDNSYVALGGATQFVKGASLVLHGKDNPQNAGFFIYTHITELQEQLWQGGLMEI